MKWISTKSKLPSSDTPVDADLLLRVDNLRHGKVYFALGTYCRDVGFTTDMGLETGIDIVTHWMEIEDPDRLYTIFDTIRNQSATT